MLGEPFADRGYIVRLFSGALVQHELAVAGIASKQSGGRTTSGFLAFWCLCHFFWLCCFSRGMLRLRTR